MFEWRCDKCGVTVWSPLSREKHKCPEVVKAKKEDWASDWEISVRCVCDECDNETTLSFGCDLGLSPGEWWAEISNGENDPNPKQMVVDINTLRHLYAWLQNLKDKGRI